MRIFLNVLCLHTLPVNFCPHCYLLCVVIHQEVEPTVGESLCRLFPPDENIDLRRIAQIARQSLKRRDPSSSAKITPASVSRSALDLSQPAPPGGLSESATSRSDKLLFGLCDVEARTSARAAVSNCWTYFGDVLDLLWCRHERDAVKTRLGRMHTDILITVWDIYAEILFLAALPWTLEWTFLSNPAARSWCCMNCKWGGIVGRTLQHFLGTFSWYPDLLLKIPLRTFRPSWMQSALRWTLVIRAVGACFISSHNSVIY